MGELGLNVTGRSSKAPCPIPLAIMKKNRSEMCTCGLMLSFGIVYISTRLTNLKISQYKMQTADQVQNADCSMGKKQTETKDCFSPDM